MESETKGLSREAVLRAPTGPPPGGQDGTLPVPEPERAAAPDSWSRPATAQNEIRPAEAPPPGPPRRSNPILPLGLVALSLVLALLALAFSLQT